MPVWRVPLRREIYLFRSQFRRRSRCARHFMRHCEVTSGGWGLRRRESDAHTCFTRSIETCRSRHNGPTVRPSVCPHDRLFICLWLSRSVFVAVVNTSHSVSLSRFSSSPHLIKRKRQNAIRQIKSRKISEPLIWPSRRDIRRMS